MKKSTSKLRNGPLRLPARLVAVSWRDLAATGVPVLILILVLVWLAFKFVRPAPPETIVLTAGPEGSSYQNNAQKYKKIIERNGISVQILTSHGALENLQRLADPAFRVDVGFVQGGLKDGIDTERLRSLGSIQTQPLLVFYRGEARVGRLSLLRGKRLAIGPEGSGTRFLAMKLLKANGIDAAPTVLLDIGGEEAAKALAEGKADAAFLMGDSATPAVMRGLLRARGLRIMNFEQADGYTRRLHFLSKLTLPKGAVDLGQNLPPEDLYLIGPTVELVAREDLHPALSDMLISAAREVHGGPGMFRDAGEFPAPLERDFPISDDAERYYKSGTQFLYSRLPFWLASLVDRMLVILLPLLVLIVPASRLVPTLYRWRVRSRIYRWYGALMGIERDMLGTPTSQEYEEILQRLGEIEEAVNNIKTPLSFADQLYVLREHISWVRHRLEVKAGEPHSARSLTEPNKV
ncbi:MAG TPA: TAXI family TRAP transporter solute-binding subunit [Burkholderiales bacterium]